MSDASDIEPKVAFLYNIGLTVRFEPIAGATFLPGLTISRGAIVVDQARLLYPGDLLHEAGHLALMTPAGRALAEAPIGDDIGMEIAAIAWSWAALRNLDLDPAVVFHADGYRGWSPALIDNFTAGRYIGVPLLQWLGMTTEKAYPAMTRWLRPEPRAD